MNSTPILGVKALITDHFPSLAVLGWNAHFAAQLEPAEAEAMAVARVVAVHRDALEVLGPAIEGRVPPPDPATPATVGDWVILDPVTRRPRRILERLSLFKRKSPGESRRVQLIAANVDTLFLVTSANDEFNPARLERYLAIAREAGVVPVVVLTKIDLAADRQPFLRAAGALAPGIIVEAVDARGAAGVAGLRPWLQPGQTIALLGSSGVGKSTLVNTLSGAERQATAAIREADARGRHTTSGRSLHRLASGAWLLDTPGMRELQLVDAAEGIDEVFDEVAALARECRFGDCTHDTEPGCAIRAALDAGRLDEDRLERYRKLVREERRNSETVAEARAKARAFGRMAKGIMEDKARRRQPPS